MVTTRSNRSPRPNRSAGSATQPPKPAAARTGTAGASPHAARTRQAPQQVRIIGGQWKRTPLPVSDADGLRPTPGRVRETLFNWLGQDLTGWRVLDAFAGSGALGLEAASRGAAPVCLLEREIALVHTLHSVVQRLKAANVVQVRQGDALSWMRQPQHQAAYDLVFLDPPFGSDLFDAALTAATACVSPGGWIYLEAARAFDAPPGLRCVRTGRAGAVHFHLFQREDAASAHAPG